MEKLLRKFRDPKYLLKLVIVGIIYYFAARLGQSLSYSNNNISLFWPATGISLSALIILGLDFWPGIALGAFASTVTTQPSALVALGMTVGITLEAVGGAYVLTLLGIKASFERVRDVIMFVVFAAILSTMISATIGTLSLVIGGAATWDNFTLIWKNWWVGDFLGDMIVAPVLLVWSRVAKFKFDLLYFVQGFVFFAAVAVSSVALFTGTFPTFTFGLQIQFKYLIFPLLIWASYKFRQKGSTLVVLLVTAITVYGVTTGSGPFVMLSNPETGLLYLGVFTAAISLTFMIFSAIIEERDRAERDVLEKEKRFRSLIENSSDVIVLLNKDGNITYTSPSTYKVLQYKPEELIETSSFDRLYPEDKPKLIKLFQELIAKPEKTIEATFRLIRKGGDVIWVDGIGTNLLTDPSVSSIILNYRDVTERVKLDESKTEFVSLSAHQLRSPVASIRWYTESLMKEASFPVNLKKYLDEIYAAILSMNETVNTLLDVSRYEMGTIRVSGAKVDLTKLVSDAIQEKNRLISQKNIKVVNSTKKEIPEVIGDETLIHLILENLLSNAIKFSPVGGLIDVSLIPQKESVLFKIKDSGVGIPTADQPKIFTKLFRGSNVNKIDPSGLGLGLYLVKQIIQLKGGDIRFESKENKGTTFFVEFPKKIKTTSK